MIESDEYGLRSLSILFFIDLNLTTGLRFFTLQFIEHLLQIV
jgi:hypothetical protein